MRACAAVLSALRWVWGSASAAGAATIKHTEFTRPQLGAAQDAMSDFLASYTVKNFHAETFGGFKAWDGTSGTTDPQNTKVGSFTTLGGHGTGNSAINGGRGLEVRNDNTMFWGRYDTDKLPGPLDNHWLDSNDTYGMRWQVKGVGAFNALAFFIADTADVGARFSIKVGNKRYSDILGSGGRLENGNISFVRILLPKTVESLTVELSHDILNDGFGIDGAMVAEIAPIPVPLPAVLLATGLAALVGLRRRSKAA